MRKKVRMSLPQICVCDTSSLNSFLTEIGHCKTSNHTEQLNDLIWVYSLFTSSGTLLCIIEDGIKHVQNQNVYLQFVEELIYHRTQDLINDKSFQPAIALLQKYSSSPIDYNKLKIRKFSPRQIVQTPDKIVDVNWVFNKLKSDEIARYLTVCFLEKYQELSIDDVLGKTMGSKMVLLQTYSNQISLWVSTTVLTSSRDQRHLIVTKFIKIAHVLKTLNNFDSMAQIVVGLNHCSVARLKHVWDKVDANSKDALSKLESIISVSNNYKNYRRTVEKLCKKPFIPLFFVVCHDIRVYLDCVPLYNNQKKIDFGKLHALSDILRVIDRNRFEYTISIKIDTQIKKFFSYIAHLDNNKLFDVSDSIVKEEGVKVTRNVLFGKQKELEKAMEESDLQTSMKESDLQTSMKESDLQTSMKESDLQTSMIELISSNSNNSMYRVKVMNTETSLINTSSDSSADTYRTIISPSTPDLDSLFSSNDSSGDKKKPTSRSPVTPRSMLRRKDSFKSIPIYPVTNLSNDSLTSMQKRKSRRMTLNLGKISRTSGEKKSPSLIIQQGKHLIEWNSKDVQKWISSQQDLTKQEQKLAKETLRGLTGKDLIKMNKNRFLLPDKIYQSVYQLSDRYVQGTLQPAKNWGIYEVAIYLIMNDLDDSATLFVKEKITGETMGTLTETDLKNELDIQAFGDRRRIMNLISQLNF